MRMHSLFLVTALVGCGDKADDSNGNATDDSSPSAEDSDNDGFAIGEDSLACGLAVHLNDRDAAIEMLRPVLRSR